MKSATRGSSSTRRTFTRHASAGDGRQRDRDGGPFAQTARHFDPSLMGLDDGLGDRQAKPKAFFVIARGVAAAAETARKCLPALPARCRCRDRRRAP